MTEEWCDRCGKPIMSQDIAYRVWVWVVARVNRELPESSGVHWDEAVARITEEFASLPEDQSTSGVYARRSFLICSACKERVLFNPFAETS